MIIAAALVVSTAILAAESDQHIGTCFAYMMQNQHGDGARAVARMTTDLEAAQHYVIAGLRKKVDVADAAAACTKLGINFRNYKPSPVLTATQKD